MAPTLHPLGRATRQHPILHGHSHGHLQATSLHHTLAQMDLPESRQLQILVRYPAAMFALESMQCA